MNTNTRGRTRIDEIVDDLAWELGAKDGQMDKIKKLLAAFALEIKRAAIEGEW